MASSWSGKKYLGLLLKEASHLRNSGCRCTSWAYNPVHFRELCGPASHSLPPIRWFTREVPALEQRNLIKQLRERTSAPIKDVKSALVGCNWDIDAAQKDLRKRGVVLASKNSSRTAAEGLLAVAQTDNRAVAIELNCETDFVARNEMFQYLASSLARIALSPASPVQELQEAFHFGAEFLQNMKIDLRHPKLSGETTVQSAITEVAAMVGENVKLRRGFALSTLSHGVVCSYLHTCPQPGLGRIAGLLSLEAEDSNASLEALKKVGSSLAMHIVAAKPLFLSREHVSSEAIEVEQDVLISQAESSGKSQMAMEKMLEGRLRKYFEEVVLLEQKFVLDNSMNVKAGLGQASVKQMNRYNMSKKIVDDKMKCENYFR